MNLTQKQWAVVGALGVVLVWSHWIIVSRIGVNSQLSPLDLSMLRFGTAAAFTAPLWLRLKWSQVNLGKSVLVAISTGFPYTLLSFYGMQTAKAARAGVLINGLLPVFGALLAITWLRYKLQWQHFMGIAIVLIANVLMLYGAGFNISESSQLLGVLYLVMASLTYSIYMACVRAWGYTFKDVLSQVPIINFVLLFPFWYAHDTKIFVTPWQGVALQSVYQGIIVTLGAGIMVTNAIQKLGAVTTSLFVAFVPAVAAILGVLYLSETLSWVEICSIIFCTLGIWIYTKA